MLFLDSSVGFVVVVAVVADDDEEGDLGFCCRFSVSNIPSRIRCVDIEVEVVVGEVSRARVPRENAPGFGSLLLLMCVWWWW